MSQKWNVLVYQAGDNNLSEEMIWALKDIIEGSKPDFRTIVQFDPIGTKPRRYDSDPPQGASASSQAVGATAAAPVLPSKTGILAETKPIPFNDIKAAFPKPFRKMKNSLTKIKKEIGNFNPKGNPSSAELFAGQVAAVQTEIDKAFDSNPNYSDIKHALSKLSSNFQAGDPVASAGVSAPGVTPSNTLSKEEKHLLGTWVEKVLAAVTECDVLIGFLEEDSAAPEIVKQFIGRYLAKGKGRKNLVVLSGHGSGAVGDFLTDDGSLTALSISSLAEMLEGKNIDILAMESCLMSMAEVCYEVRAHNQNVEFVVGSEGLMLNSGWPYKHILENPPR